MIPIGMMLVNLGFIDFLNNFILYYFLLLVLFFPVGCFPHKGFSFFGFLIRLGWTSLGGLSISITLFPFLIFILTYLKFEVFPLSL